MGTVGWESLVSTLQASVAAGESGPLIVLSGEADVTNTPQLSAVLDGQLASGTRYLTVDVTGLSFADTSSIRTLLLASRTLRQRGGDLVLLRPQPALARMLEILGAQQLLAIRDETGAAPEPEP
jgi:anti-sigma B factor antagonist